MKRREFLLSTVALPVTFALPSFAKSEPDILATLQSMTVRLPSGLHGAAAVMVRYMGDDELTITPISPEELYIQPGEDATIINRSNNWEVNS